MNEQKVLSYLGLAERAGKAVSGEYQVEEAIKRGTAAAVFVAGDASDNTKKSFRDKCERAKVKYIEIADRARLGNAVGKEFRASAAIIDKGLAEAAKKAAEGRK